MNQALAASLALAIVLVPVGTRAQSAADLEALRQEIGAMRAEYEARLRALEARLRTAESAAAEGSLAGAGASATPTPAAPRAAGPVNGLAPGANAGAPGVSVPAGAAPGAAAASAFNPAVSLILTGQYVRLSRDPAGWGLTGLRLPTGGEFGPGQRGFGIGESELRFEANIDPWWRGVATVALHPDDAVSVEEAYVQTTALGHGLSAKAGRFLSGVGYLNPQHPHTWDFIDAPLAYQAFLGRQVGDDGVQLRWLAPTDQYLELGAEVGRGRTYPGSDTARNGAGMVTLSAHTGGDVGESHSWRAGVSLLRAKADGLALGGLAGSGGLLEANFSGRTRVWVADGVWKWAPDGDATRTSFKLQGEYLRSQRDGTLADAAGNETALSGAQSGWYLQGVYQFRPRWRAGLRTERLDAGTSDAALAGGLRYRPRKDSAILEFATSEYARLRLQLARERTRTDAPDNQFFLQYQMSLGAHGAHRY